MQFKRKLLLAAMLSATMATLPVAPVSADDDDDDDDRRPYGEMTVIHIGDIHGHLTPRPNLRSDGDGRMEGGLARMYKKIKRIRGEDPQNTLLVNTGDTIQGSGEALYTRGQALVDVLDMFKIGAYTPGNWDFVYGPERFKELFQTVDSNGNIKSKRWGGLVSNVYETDPNAPMRPSDVNSHDGANASKKEWDDYSQWYTENGKRILPPTAIKTINGVKVGILGCTTSRGPQVVGSWVTNGLEFTECSFEVPKFAKQLRDAGVDMVMLISEIEIGRNIELMKALTADAHIDVVLNSDMHEETWQPIKVTTAGGKQTLIIEEGQDGTQLGELNVKKVAAGQVTLSFKAHRIHSGIEEDDDVAYKVARVSAPFNSKFDASIPCTVNSPYANPLNIMGLTDVTDADITCLAGPLSKVVGRTDIGLHRSNYSHEGTPAAVEGTSHDFVADAIRWWAKSDFAAVRGFRYGTHVKPGPITRNDLYHFVPIGPRVGKGSRVAANQMRNQIDNSSIAVFSSDPHNSITPRPNYNNKAYAPGGAKAGQSPGAGLPAYGGAGNARGFAGGWLFAYSAPGFHFDFDPYFVPSSHKYRTGNPLGLDANGISNLNAQGNTISGIYLDIDPVTGLSYNGQYANPPTDTSRARNWMVEMPCNKLPVSDRKRKDIGWNGESAPYAAGVNVITLNNDVSCAPTIADPNDPTATIPNPGYTGVGKTVITKAKDGVYMPAWTANYTNGLLASDHPSSAGFTNNYRADLGDTSTACNKDAAGANVNNTCGYTPWLLNPDGWRYLRGTPNQPDTTFTINQHFKAALFKIAGYWYKQSPNTVNNCNNCFVGGSVDGNVMGNMSITNPADAGNKLMNPEVAYLLPVNEIDGKPALDANLNPLLVQDPTKPDGLARDSNNKPISAGKPIELTEIMVKYLESLDGVEGDGNYGTVNASNLPQDRIGLVKTRADGTGNDPTTLPDFRTTMGFPVMQPLCGTIGLDGPAVAADCPSYP